MNFYLNLINISQERDDRNVKCELSQSRSSHSSIINASNVIKRISVAHVYFNGDDGLQCSGSQIARRKKGGERGAGGRNDGPPVCISQQIYGYLVHVRDKARTFWLSAI